MANQKRIPRKPIVTHGFGVTRGGKFIADSFGCLKRDVRARTWPGDCKIVRAVILDEEAHWRYQLLATAVSAYIRDRPLGTDIDNAGEYLIGLGFDVNPMRPDMRTSTFHARLIEILQKYRDGEFNEESGLSLRNLGAPLTLMHALIVDAAEEVYR